MLAKFVCDEPDEDCYYRICKKCPQASSVIDALNEIFEANEIDNINYKMWTATNHCTLIQVGCTTEKFLDFLLDQIDKILRHDFDAKSQSRYYSTLKTILKPGEFIVTLDFAENYAFVVQEAAQAFHWNNDQATIFPMVIYFVENGESKHLSFVVISDCKNHDTIAVYIFQQELIIFLKEKFQEVIKIYYFSDGAPQQFKNKSAFTNLCHHKRDFDIDAEWHFFATAHGKGPCDGLAGSIKRLASRKALQMGTKKEILTPFALYEWANEYFDNIHFTFVSQEVYNSSAQYQKERFTKAKPLKGTQSVHCIVPCTENFDYCMVKKNSSSKNSTKIKMIKP